MAMNEKAITRFPSLLRNLHREDGAARKPGDRSPNPNNQGASHSALNFLQAADSFEPVVNERKSASYDMFLSGPNGATPAAPTWLEKLKAMKTENEAAR
eukprot:1454221-Rhodomonas_salina.1